eukprot:scaffold732_cov165-Pinguiococcus_pyrenoidosus.AAC.1
MSDLTCQIDVSPKDVSVGERQANRFIRMERHPGGLLHFLGTQATITKHVNRAFGGTIVENKTLSTPPWAAGVLDSSGGVQIAIQRDPWTSVVSSAARAGLTTPRRYERAAASSELWHGTAWRDLEEMAKLEGVPEGNQASLRRLSQASVTIRLGTLSGWSLLG